MNAAAEAKVAYFWRVNETSLDPAPDFRRQLSQLREAVLELHKALVDSERVSYEQNLGTIPSPNHFLQLLTNDPWFAWLHPLSQRSWPWMRRSTRRPKRR